ncbi:MAG: ferrous iron transport protein B [Fidelibacterota bacterium]|nr:MAG: ferrous iron transport protein B [Candidatus Neomarinimicrobiota bacterium]
MHNHRKAESGATGRRTIALVGNPNVGKSVVFGYLTGRYVNVSNYPGTTVEVARGRLTGERNPRQRGPGRRHPSRSTHQEHQRGRGRSRGTETPAHSHTHRHRQGDWEVIDTPGVNNLIPSSEDEVVTRNILMNETPSRIIQVADAKNIRRGLLLSLQLSEMGLPYTLCLNMTDEARDRGIQIDTAALSKALGVKVVDTIATQKVGLDEVKRLTMDRTKRPHPIPVDYPAPIRKAVQELEPLLPESQLSPQAVALMLLTADETLLDWLSTRVDGTTLQVIHSIRDRTRRAFSRSMNVEITQARMRAASRLMDQVLQQRETRLTSLAQSLSRAAVHPVGGFAFVAAVLAGMYYFVGVFGAGILVDWLEEGLFGGYIIPGLTRLVETVLPWQLLRDLLVGEFGLLSMALSYSVAIVLPIVGTFFIAFGILEDSGYLPRLSVMMNRVFKVMGLNGKAVLPMVLGLGCDTMATMTTRILDSRKERLIVTLLLALGVPCSAQLGVILAMIQGISLGAAVLWFGIVLGTIFLVGYLSAKVLPGRSSDFLLEMPPLRRPLVGNIVIKTMARLEWYLREAVPLFFLGTLLLFVMDRLAILAWIEAATSPVIQSFLGLPREATAAFIMGFLRRDYGAAGLFLLAREGQLDPIQILVSLVVITLFMPCIANLFMIIKEQGWKVALGMTAFILPFAIVIGGAVNWSLRLLNGVLP